MYSIDTAPFGNFEKIYLRNMDTNEYAAIIPQFGANLNELVLNNGIQSFAVVDGDTTPHELILNAAFKSAKLTPFPNRINQGKYSFNDKDYQLMTNMPPHAIHGLVFNKEFSVVSQTATVSEASIVLHYQYRAETTGYPFNFDVELRFLLSQNGLSTTTTITNTGAATIPVGDGWHLYFQCPSKVDNCLLQLPSDNMLVSDATLIPTGIAKPYIDFSTSKMIGNTAFDDCFTISLNKPIAEVVLTDVASDLSVIAWQEVGNRKYNYVQIYTPPHRNSIAIEPMTCPPNVLNNKERLIVLQPNEKLVIDCGVKVERARMHLV